MGIFGGELFDGDTESKNGIPLDRYLLCLRAKFDFKLQRFPFTEEGNLAQASGRQLHDGKAQSFSAADGLSVDVGHDVAAEKAAPFGSRVGHDFGNKSSAGPFFEVERFDQVFIEILDVSTEESAVNTAVFTDLFIYHTGDVGRNGEADSVAGSALGKDRRIDADHFAAEVEQRPARMSRVDGSVRLDKIFELRNLQIPAVRGTHDAGRNGVAKAERMTDGKHPFTDLHFIRVPEFKAREVFARNFENGDVGIRIDADQLCFEFYIFFFIPFDDNFGGIFYDVVIGNDVAIGGNKETGSGCDLARRVMGSALLRRRKAEKFVKKLILKLFERAIRIVELESICRLAHFGADMYYGGTGLFCNGDECARQTHGAMFAGFQIGFGFG